MSNCWTGAADLAIATCGIVDEIVTPLATQTHVSSFNP